MRKNAKQYVEVVCAATGEHFLKEKKEYDRQVRQGHTRFFKNRQVAVGPSGRHINKAPISTKTCLCCSSPFTGSGTHHERKRFCSRVCAAKGGIQKQRQDPIAWSERSTKLSQAFEKQVQQGKRHKGPMMETASCVVCHASFERKKYAPRKTCSRHCHTELRRKISREHPNVGGECYPRKRRYKDVSMDSSWEVALATWLDEREIKWLRSRKLLLWWTDQNGNRRRYYPDFYLPKQNLYLEPKNKTLMERDAFKIAQVLKENPVTILMGTVGSIIEQLLPHLN